MGEYYVGLDIGGTKCSAVLGEVGEKIRILDKLYFLTRQQAPSQILARFDAFIESKAKCFDIRGIGISCGGPLDSKKGLILQPPSLPLWDQIPVVEHFQKRFALPTYLQNDANACAMAEWKYGAGKGSKEMVFLTFGTGFGAGLILNGKLYSGFNDNAGEIGHIRLTKEGPVGYRKEGSCEGYCSGSGMVRLAKIMGKQARYQTPYLEYLASVGGESKISAKSMALEARKGNAFCTALYRKSGEMLGRALSILIDLLNPEIIVIGGIFMRASDLLLPSCKKELEKECLSFSLSPVEIRPAGLGESIGDIAALCIGQGGSK